MTKNYTSGLNFTWPTLGDTSWASTVDAALAVISAHTHDGAGGGAGLAANSVTGTKILLANNSPLRAYSTTLAITNLLQYNSSNILELLQSTTISNGYFALSSFDAVVASGALSLNTVLTVLNGTTLSMTLAAGVQGQIKLVVNSNSTTATVTPSPTAGANTVAIGQYGAAIFIFMDGEWRPFCTSSGATQLTDDFQAFSAAGTWSGNTKTVIATGTTYTITMPGASIEGQTVLVRNSASGSVTFGAQVMGPGTYYLYSYLGGAWRRTALT